MAQLDTQSTRPVANLLQWASLLVLIWAALGCPKTEPAIEPKSPDRSTNAPLAPIASVKRPNSLLAAGTSNEQIFVQAMTGHRNARYVADLKAIQKRKVLRVITQNNSTSYFLYRGVEAGFHYDLAKWFTEELGVRLEIVVSPTTRDLVPWLLQGRGDLIVSALPTDAPRANRVLFTRPFLHTTLVLITRTDRVPKISSVEHLRSANIMVQPSTNTIRYLRRLSGQLDFSLNLKAAQETSEAEDLLEQVASGQIDATVVEKRIAKVELLHHDNLRIALEFDDATQTMGFATLPENKRLLRAADNFLRKYYRGTRFNMIYNRYHKNRARTKKMRDSHLRADRDGALTPWDPIFQSEAKSAELDWRLIAAQAVQESRLDPSAVSQFGARGLMQLMPATAKELGVRHLHSPASSIAGGTRYMNQLMRRFDAPDIALKDRVRFSLASYNAGSGHVDDARRLAKRMGLNPNRWFQNVEKAMLLLSKPKYYQKAKYGYCRGTEPVRYVSEIQSRYDNYVALTDLVSVPSNSSP
jgi:membrane-bound lytic murein transglycosylase F